MNTKADTYGVVCVRSGHVFRRNASQLDTFGARKLLFGQKHNIRPVRIPFEGLSIALGP